MDGDLVGAGWVSGGSDRKLSTLEVTSEIDKAGRELAAAETQVAELSAALAGALTEQSARQDSAEQALAALNESDAAISAMYEQLGRLGQDARAAEDEWSRLLQQREELEAGRASTVDEVTELETRLRNAQETQQVHADAPSSAAARQQSPPPPKTPAPSRWKPGWRCGPPRNAPTRCAGGRTRCAARPPPNARRGCGPPKRTPRGCGRPRWPRRSPSPGGCWRRG